MSLCSSAIPNHSLQRFGITFNTSKSLPQQTQQESELCNHTFDKVKKPNKRLELNPLFSVAVTTPAYSPRTPVALK